MKKIIFLLVVSLLFCSCSKKAQPTAENNKISVVCTVFPAYDWVREIADGTDIALTLIPSNGTDIHSYQPTAQDIIDISECDLFIYSGTEEKAWYDDALSKDVTALNIAEFADDDYNFHHKDEHVWLSLEIASEIVEGIAYKLSQINPEAKLGYLKNAEIYEEKLEALDEKYENTVENSKRRIILVADRFPFRYLTEEYDIKYFSAFEGCSAESEVSFETIAGLSKKCDEYKLNHILTAEASDNRIAEAVINNSQNPDIEISALNSMQSVTAREIEAGISYISVMQENLSVLKEALN